MAIETKAEPLRTIRASLAVGRVDQLTKDTTLCSGTFETVASQAVVEAFLSKRDDFEANGIPRKIDIGYHYTGKDNMDSIKQHGLLTRADLFKQGIDASLFDNVFGDGIYTGNNPTSFDHYGSIGLIVARLQGNTQRVANSYYTGEANTVIGNSSNDRAPSKDQIILRSSAQCLPLVSFERGIASVEEVEPVARALEESLIDKIFEATASSPSVETVRSSKPANLKPIPLAVRKAAYLEAASNSRKAVSPVTI